MHRVVITVYVIMVLGQQGYAEEQRVKRFPHQTLASLGARALQSFLTGALKLKSDPPRVTQYVKTGGWEVAKTEVGALDVITRRSSFGTPKNWKIVATDQGPKYGKIVGDRFIEVFPPTKVHPAMVRVSKMYRKTKKVTVLEEPVEIKYLKKGNGRNKF